MMWLRCIVLRLWFIDMVVVFFSVVSITLLMNNVVRWCSKLFFKRLCFFKIFLEIMLFNIFWILDCFGLMEKLWCSFLVIMLNFLCRSLVLTLSRSVLNSSTRFSRRIVIRLCVKLCSCFCWIVFLWICMVIMLCS